MTARVPAASPRVAGTPRRLRDAAVRRAPGALVALAVVLGLPAVAAGHGLSPVYQSPLPLAVYLVGAAATVALSFVFVLARDVRATTIDEGRIVHVPRRAPHRPARDRRSSAGSGSSPRQSPAGRRMPPSRPCSCGSTAGWASPSCPRSCSRSGSGSTRSRPSTTCSPGSCGRSASAAGPASEVPAAVRVWPAVVGLAFFVWLELVPAVSAATLTVVLVGYTVLTLAMMAQFGRDEWRAQGETFTVWFRTLDRLAPFGVVAEAASTGEESRPDADDVVDPGGIDVARAHVVRRSFASGLLEPAGAPRSSRSSPSASGRSCSTACRRRSCSRLFGVPGLVPKTLLLLALARDHRRRRPGRVGRAVGIGATGAGLLPIAVGYLIAHYLTYLLIDGQRIVDRHLRSAPARLGHVRHRVLPARAARGCRRASCGRVQLAAVVGGHMLGALGRARRRRRRERTAAALTAAALRTSRQVPLAVVMVGLTTLTLWSLGQAIVGREPAAPTTSTRRRRGLEPASRPDRPSRPARTGRAGHPVVERADLGQPLGDRRIERLGGGDRGLHRGQAQDPLGGRRLADLGGVADRARARRRRVDDEPDLAGRDRARGSGPRRARRRPPRRAWRRARPRSPTAASACAGAGRRRAAGSRPPASAAREAGQRAPCRGPRSRRARAPPSAPGRGGTSARAEQRLGQRDPRVRRGCR